MKSHVIKIFILAFLFVSGSSSSGIVDMTMFSRANCATINESISWDATRKWVMDVISYQLHINGESNTIYDVMNDEPRYRAYAGCVLCGYGGWYVAGAHYLLDTKYDSDQEYFIVENCPAWEAFTWSERMLWCKTSVAIDCNLGEW